MPIVQTKKQSDIEKRLKLLRQQVYGRETEKPVKVKWEVSGEKMEEEVRRKESLIQHQYDTSSLREASHVLHPISNPQLLRSDIIFLRHDLLKITSFATVAFGIQIVLYFLLRNNIIKLPFGG